MFDNDFLHQFNIAGYAEKYKFYSKKNAVSLYVFWDDNGAKKEWVVKKYRYGDIRQEKKIINYLYEGGAAVPGPVYFGADYLVMEYINGKTMLCWLNDREKSGEAAPDIKETAAMWASWFMSCYLLLDNAFGRSMVLGDVNWRNFILAAGNIYGLDFEDCRPGRKEEDAGKLCAYALTYHPAFTPWKYNFVSVVKQSFAGMLSLCPALVSSEMAMELIRIKKRRE